MPSPKESDNVSVQIKLPIAVPWGHEPAFDFLKKAFVSGRAAHAYLITGRAGSGRLSLARAVAAHLLETDALESQPDFVTVERSLDPKTGKPRAVIAVSQIQELCSRLSRRSFLGGWTVAVIRDSQYLNRESGNALLKTLEEPHDKTLLLLTAPDVESVLPTIRSRCQEIRLPRVSPAVLKEGLATTGLLSSEASMLARLADGRPGLAWYLATEPMALSELRERRSVVLSLSRIDYAERWQAIETLLPKKLTFQDVRRRALEFLDLTAELLRDALLVVHGQDDRLVHADVTDEIRSWTTRPGFDPLQALDALQQTRLQIEGNVVPRSALQAFVLHL